MSYSTPTRPAATSPGIPADLLTEELDVLTDAILTATI
jgi:hypothetical protein